MAGGRAVRPVGEAKAGAAEALTEVTTSEAEPLTAGPSRTSVMLSPLTSASTWPFSEVNPRRRVDAGHQVRQARIAGCRGRGHRDEDRVTAVEAETERSVGRQLPIGRAGRHPRDPEIGIAGIPDQIALGIAGREVQLHLGVEGVVAVVVGQARDQVVSLQDARLGHVVNRDQVVKV